MWLLHGNVLVALSVSSHVLHARATAWFTARPQRPFALCMVTEGTLLRVAMSPALKLSAADTWRVLGHVKAQPGAVFWNDGFSYQDVGFRALVGAAQVTDAWLAELARRKRAKLATFDSGLFQAHPDVAELIP